MSLVAAFLWNKSPRTYVCSMIFDEENMQILVPPKIEFFAKGYFRFRTQAKQTIKNFYAHMKRLHLEKNKPFKLEYKIVAEVNDIPYMMPAKESLFVKKIFLKELKQATKKIKKIKVGSQLRSRLSGQALRHFKRELQSLYLVRRKRDTGYEYHLWTVALHATKATHQAKLKKVRKILVDAIWNEAS